MKKYLVLVFVSFRILAAAQLAEPWIAYPSANVNAYGVYHFRRSFDLETIPSKLVVQVSADNRYQLFVNGTRVSYGPAKGDLKTYKYDELDIAKFLQKGKNVIAALVFNMGKERPMALITAQTAFLFRTSDPSYKFLNSDTTWKFYKNPAYNPIWYNQLKIGEWMRGYYAVGPGDEVFASKYPWGWEKVDYDDSQWIKPEILNFDGNAPWNLVARNIAFMDTHIDKPQMIRQATGIDLPADIPYNEKSVVIPPNTRAKILFDFENFTMGYPELTVDQGENSIIKVRYNETLFEKPYLKSHRDSVAGKQMFGPFDIYRSDGEKRTFRPLWKRAFRYLELDIKTENEPLIIHSLLNEYSGYPYEEMATFKTDDSRLNEMFDMSLRTLKMCSGETYYDTPFYEQMSYGGDNRPIGAISGYNTTDDRLFREMMRIYPQSVNKETGLFKAAYPSRFDFDKGSWSLAWIQTLWDYYQLRGDASFSKQFVNDIEGVLDFFHRHIDEELGVLGVIEGHHYLDWSKHSGKVPTGLPKWYFEHSSGLTLFYAHTLDCAVNLFRVIGENEKARKWEAISQELKKSTYDLFWDEDKKMMMEYPGDKRYSQHTNILAVLCDAIPRQDQEALLKRIVTYEFDEEVSSFFAFYLFKAMEKVNREDLYFNSLYHWEHFIDMGLTTCGETGFAIHDRSDCHAWSGSPGYFHLRFIAGVKPANNGFDQILIEPVLGHIKNLTASMPHPKGRIEIQYEIRDDLLSATIVLPTGLSGTFSYSSETKPLTAGINTISIRF